MHKIHRCVMLSFEAWKCMEIRKVSASQGAGHHQKHSPVLNRTGPRRCFVGDVHFHTFSLVWCFQWFIHVHPTPLFAFFAILCYLALAQSWQNAFSRIGPRVQMDCRCFNVKALSLLKLSQDCHLCCRHAAQITSFASDFEARACLLFVWNPRSWARGQLPKISTTKNHLALIVMFHIPMIPSREKW